MAETPHAETPLDRPAHAAEDWTVPQDWDRYSAADHAMWDRLFERQARMLPGRVVPDRLFFDHLANRRFPAGRFIRTPSQEDYLEEPDVFHDVFGHVPLLANPVFADYMQAYGQGGLRADGLGAIEKLARLYWYTVEFGLMLEAGELRAYGAGILSGPTEVVYALEGKSPNRIMLNVDRVMRTDYVIDDLQPTYFVIESFADLYHQTVDRDFDRLYRSLPPSFTYANSAIIDVDDVLTRGTQEYFLRGGRGSGAVPV